ncbi:MAG: hypothetical protein SGI72_15070 [Planctomycetota bacterium]|nr:hypothetical protein [Planctomycetota bacterium]
MDLQFDLLTPGVPISATTTRHSVDLPTFVVTASGTNAGVPLAPLSFDMTNAPGGDGVMIGNVALSGGTVSFSFTDPSANSFQSSDALANLGSFGGSCVFTIQASNGVFVAQQANLSLALPPAGMLSCAGDGSTVPCPCNNDSFPTWNFGCSHSVFSSGARLRAVGNPSIQLDTIAFEADTLPPGSAGLFFQGQAVPAANFGDGLLCVGGSIRRLNLEFVDASFSAKSPSVGAPSPLSVAGSCLAGEIWTYQFWYRDAAPTYCTPATFNLANAVTLTWTN